MILGEQGDFEKEYSPQEVPKSITLGPFITLIAVQEFVLGRQKKMLDLIHLRPFSRFLLQALTARWRGRRPDRSPVLKPPDPYSEKMM